jgi:hypothetical protein
MVTISVRKKQFYLFAQHEEGNAFGRDTAISQKVLSFILDEVI